MTELWLPTTCLRRCLVSDIPRGKLLATPPVGSKDSIVRLGIRFDSPSRSHALALTPFHGGRTLRWDAVDLSPDDAAISIDAQATFEADLLAPATSGDARDYLPGELVDTDEGLGIAALFGRHERVMEIVKLVSVDTWEAIGPCRARTIFSAWRLRLDIEGIKPVFWRPDKHQSAIQN